MVDKQFINRLANQRTLTKEEKEIKRKLKEEKEKQKQQQQQKEKYNNMKNFIQEDRIVLFGIEFFNSISFLRDRMLEKQKRETTSKEEIEQAFRMVLLKLSLKRYKKELQIPRFIDNVSDLIYVFMNADDLEIKFGVQLTEEDKVWWWCLQIEFLEVLNLLIRERIERKIEEDFLNDLDLELL